MALTTLRVTSGSLHCVPGGPDLRLPFPPTSPPATSHLLTILRPATPAPWPLLWTSASLVPSKVTIHLSLCLSGFLPPHPIPLQSCRASFPPFIWGLSIIQEAPSTLSLFNPLLYFPLQQLPPPTLTAYIFVYCPYLSPRM